MKKITVLLVLFVSLVTGAFAQTIYTLGQSGLGTTTTDITTCNAIIYDSGGENGSYSPGEDFWLTIHPTSGAVTLRFSGELGTTHGIATTDTLFVYNGTDPNNDSIPLLIGSYSANWVNDDNMIQVGDQEVSATIQNPTGALTIHFKSSASSQTGVGFYLLVSCSEPCQRLHANIDFANSNPTPHYDPELNDGYYYVDFCPGDTVHIATYATYPDNNYSYFQEEGNTYFDWSFGQSGNGMSDLYYVFNEGQGYDLTLSIHDVHNGVVCYGQTPVSIRIRGSRDPLVNANLLNDVCQGTEIPLLVSMDENADIIVEPVGSTQESSLAVDSTVFIPDGPNCTTQCYSSSVNFTSFPPGATITQASDILGVRLNIEHSYIGDINISLICPNSHSVQLMPDHCGNVGGTNYAFFGLYYEPDGSYCNASDNIQGTGWNYCWSENNAYAQNSGYCYINANIGHDVSSTVDSSHVAHGYPGQGGFVQGQQYYTPYQSFSNLVGCPLNGLWQIQVCDTWSSDNGYIFSWELTLDPSLMPQDWTYNVGITEVDWSGGNIVPTSDSTSVIITDQPGEFSYTFTIIDEFNCTYPHNMDLKVVQQPEFTLTDQNICEGETAVLDPQFEYVGPAGLIDYNWNTSAATPSISTTQNGEYSVCISTYNDNEHTLTCSKCDTAEVVFYPQPIVSFTSDVLENCAPLNFHLIPNVTYTDGLPHDDDVTLTYQWTITNANNEVVETSSQENPFLSLQDAGLYSVHLYVETQNGCADSSSRIGYLTVFAQPISDFLSNPERTNLGEGGTIIFINITDTSVFAPNDVVHWTWSYGEGDDTYDINGEHTYTTWGEYTVNLSVETDQGCKSSVSHVVYIEQDLEFPNIITPNGDGKNDVFAIRNMNPLLPNNLSIYDRWGKKVYEKKNYQTYAREGSDVIENAGDGFGADKLSDGVYYFTFHYEGYTKAVDYHGTLTVIRDK